MLVFGSVVWPSRTVHVLPGVRVPCRGHAAVRSCRRRRRVEDAVSGTVLHGANGRPPVARVGCRTPADLGVEQRRARTEARQREALLPAGTHAVRPTTLSRPGHSPDSCSTTFVSYFGCAAAGGVPASCERQRAIAGLRACRSCDWPLTIYLFFGILLPSSLCQYVSQVIGWKDLLSWYHSRRMVSPTQTRLKSYLL